MAEEMKKIEKIYKYPNQTIKMGRQKMILGVDAFLSTPDLNDENSSPLELHSNFSRFVMTLIDKSGEVVKTPKGNIPAEDIDEIRDRTSFAKSKLYEREFSPAKNDGGSDSLAYTEKFRFGDMAGKTPAQALLEGKKIEDLNAQREMLEKNLSKFKTNQSLIDAIDDAITLFNLGELTKKSTSETIIDIYNNKDKTFKYFTKENEKGEKNIYCIRVFCDLTKNYPYSVYITNAWAPLEKDKYGKTQLKLSAMHDKIESHMSLSVTEWHQIVNQMSSVKDKFENMVFSKMFQASEEAFFNQRKK